MRRSVDGTTDILAAQPAHADEGPPWGHVAAVRSVKAAQILHDQEVTRTRLRETQFSHWTDGWLMGYLFQDLGGHRDD